MSIVIDNYDSFTYNLVQYIGEIDSDILVYKNNKITIEEILNINPNHIIISPGPGRPEDAGVSIEIIDLLKDTFPIMGICLGHQAIGYSFGAKIINAEDVFHGKTSQIYHNNNPIFRDVPSPFIATRYHSLIIDKESLNDEFDIIASTSEDLIMGIKHKDYNLYGLQFHPESILTNYGMTIIRNFLK